MANKGTSKELSVRHEDYIARLFGGRRSRSSGAAITDAGDVRHSRLLIECKMTGHPGKEPKSLPRFVQYFEKIVTEAWEESKDPMLALRYYCPNSRLSNSEGWIDLTLMLATDHAAREAQYDTEV